MDAKDFLTLKLKPIACAGCDISPIVLISERVRPLQLHQLARRSGIRSLKKATEIQAGPEVLRRTCRRMRVRESDSLLSVAGQSGSAAEKQRRILSLCRRGAVSWEVKPNEWLLPGTASNEMRRTGSFESRRGYRQSAPAALYQRRVSPAHTTPAYV